MVGVLTAARLLSAALLSGIGIAAPALLAMLLADLLLGMLSRFAPQLNAFSIALTVKSVIACLILLMYLGPDTFLPAHSLFNALALETLF